MDRMRCNNILNDLQAAAEARERHNAAVNQLRAAEKKLSDEELTLSRINDPKWFGADGVWKKLDGTCLTKDTGE
jgi:protein kinase C substrate 80K-H